MNADRQLLLRYVDGEMSRFEEQRFRARLAATPDLRQELAEIEHVGKLVRLWASEVEGRAGGLLEPTLSRVAKAEKRRVWQFSAALAAAVALVALASWTAPERFQRAPRAARTALSAQVLAADSAAIERLDPGAQEARVFVVGRRATPVVWLVDDAEQTTLLDEPGPG